ncbi:MAG: amino acid ABC transporter permease [Brevinemataceae bacterium]
MEYLSLLHHVFVDGGRYLYIIRGLAFSLSVTVFSAVLGTVWGILLALMALSQWTPFRNSSFNPLKTFAVNYINIIRGTPVVVQLMFLANVIFVGLFRDVPILIVAGIAFGLNSGAYAAEIIRAGIESIDKGQYDAARALGMSYYTSMREIIIPQAVKNILPALVNEFITLLKETSIVGFIGGIDLLRAANIITSQTYRGVEPLIVVGLIYFVLVTIFTKIMKKFEERLKKSD